MRRATLLLMVCIATGASHAAEIEARLTWAERMVLGTLQSGTVAEVAVRPGQQVRAGALLAALDGRHLKARLARAEAQLEEARQDKAEADRELERALELHERTVLSNHDRNLAQINAARAEALWRDAQAALAEARIELEQSRLVAPFDAVVVEVTAQRGQVVLNRLRLTPLVTVASAKHMLASALVSGETAAGLRLDQPVQVGIGDRWIEGKVVQLGLEPEPGKEQPPRYLLTVLFTRPADMSPRVGVPAMIRVTK